MTQPAWFCPQCQAALVCTDDRHVCSDCGWVRRREGRIWLAREAPQPAGFDADAVKRLQTLESHFWMRGRRRLVERLLRRIAAPGRCAVELGCGTGGLLTTLEHGFARVTAVDAHAVLLQKAALNSTRAELFQADVTRTSLPGNENDLVIALDVIEHVDPDALLAEARRITAPNGVLLLSAPSAPSLWSRMDELAGHRCRYTRKQLTDELTRNGWEPQGFTHYQCLLFPLVWLSHAHIRCFMALAKVM